MAKKKVSKSKSPTSKKQKPTGNVTVHDVAKYLGVAPSTVSTVLNGHAEKRKITQDTVDKVQKAARELNYRPNLMAQSIRLRSTKMIGVLLKDFYMGWGQLIIDGMQAVFDEKGYRPVMLIDRWDPEAERKQLNDLIQLGVDGILCLPNAETPVDVYSSVSDYGVPLVFFGNEHSEVRSVSSVVWDAEPAAEELVDHLVEELGCKTILFVGTNHVFTQEARYRGFIKAKKKHKLSTAKRWEHWFEAHASWPEQLNADIKKIIGDADKRPDAIFAHNDIIAYTLWGALRKAGIRVPEEVQLVGMDGIPLMRTVPVPITTMNEPTEKIGKMAAELMIKKIEEKDSTCLQLKIQHNEIIRAGLDQVEPEL